MNLQALCHIPCSNYAYAYNDNELHIRLRTAKDDMDKVKIYYGPKFQWHQKQSSDMQKIMSDEFYDYYEYRLKVEDSRVGYYFELIRGREKLIYTEAGFVEAFNDDMGYCYFFQYPYINSIDVHREPEWIKDAVFYQIFVERFYNGNKANSPIPLSEWDADPTPKSFFGGDLQGIIEKLDYLEEIGINSIYLTPIFESPSNHKYDIVNYLEIDHYFGDKEVFKELVQQAHKRGIRIILDAVFNHCSYLSEQFQDVMKKGRASKYYDWFFIKGDKPDYKQMNYLTFSIVPYMPKLNTENEKVREFLYEVVRYWTETFEIDGWRLDVSDEIDHEFWRGFRKVLKGINKEAIIIGENWHNASPWLMGEQFDSVMNYPVTKLMGDFFAREEIGADTFINGISTLLMRYPKQVNEAMLNLLDSHDTERFLTTCKGNIASLKNAAAFLFGYVGMPCIYYGTEIGMDGVYDPGCRKGFIWDREKWNMALFGFYKKLIKIRKTEPALMKGEISFTHVDDLVVMHRSYGNERIDIIINQSDGLCTYKIAIDEGQEVYELLSDRKLKPEIQVLPKIALYIKVK
ncbi:MAG: glycoside hydrolase family 13 protein [Cellulosilyticum sp.]|nr:glycoside hydrolase family 13 protein [Cellulosilyticum sp.]